VLTTYGAIATHILLMTNWFLSRASFVCQSPPPISFKLFSFMSSPIGFRSFVTPSLRGLLALLVLVGLDNFLRPEPSTTFLILSFGICWVTNSTHYSILYSCFMHPLSSSIHPLCMLYAPLFILYSSSIHPLLILY
jgi:hypothetical protein